jgi:hypothetical protein
MKRIKLFEQFIGESISKSSYSTLKRNDIIQHTDSGIQLRISVVKPNVSGVILNSGTYIGKPTKMGDVIAIKPTEIEEWEMSSLDEAFFRLPSNIIGNELYTVAKNLNSFYDRANSGNDIDIEVLDSIIKKLNMIKKSAKKFNDAEEIKGTAFESLDEAVYVDTSRYERSYGKKPRGKGSWAFYFDRTGGRAIFTPSSMTYADAVNWAKEQAKEAGKSIVYVGESVNEELANEQVTVNRSTYKVSTAIKKELEDMKKSGHKEKPGTVDPMSQLLKVFMYNNNPEAHINKPEFSHLKQAYIQIRDKYDL